MNEPAKPFPMVRYLLQFIGVSVLVILAMLAFSISTRIELPQSMGMAALVVSTLLVGLSFAKRERREPTRKECAWFATLASLLVTALSLLSVVATLVALAGSFSILMPLLHSPSVLLAALFFGLAVSWLVIYFSFGVFVRQGLKRL